MCGTGNGAGKTSSFAIMNIFARDRGNASARRDTEGKVWKSLKLQENAR